jgi:hypothetical protein
LVFSNFHKLVEALPTTANISGIEFKNVIFKSWKKKVQLYIVGSGPYYQQLSTARTLCPEK